jgi:CzcA family heavy metal efflux pump
MLNAIIRFSLHNRLLILAISIFVTIYGGWQLTQLPIDVFPDLDRPRVTIITESHGMAPEEIESLITIPLESVLNGATGVQAVRSSSDAGLSIIYVEFDWGTDIYRGRQVVNEKLALVAERMPEGVQPQLAPISSLMGQVLILGMWSETGATSPLELRTLADWTVRQRLLTVPGVAQVITMGGGRKQFQVLVDPQQLARAGVTLHEIEQALEESNSNVTGGYLDDQGPNELLVRSLGRISTIEDLEKLVVKPRAERPLLLGEVAQIVEGPQPKRGESSTYLRREDGTFSGGPAVVITIAKQPEADTRQLTTEVLRAVRELRRSLPRDVKISADFYQQKQFIDLAVENVVEALRDGGVLVVVILFLFLMNVRTTFITLTAIPLSIVVTGLIFRWLGLSINTMTLGGLAVAIGELVDDSIVDVENIYRRLKENRLAGNPKSSLQVVYEASSEVRNSIVYSTILIVLVFLPLFALSGMEGRLFTPLGIAYVVSILASLVVSLTLTPVLSYWLLPNMRAMKSEADGVLLGVIKKIAGAAIRFSLVVPKMVVIATACVVLASVFVLMRLESDFLPPFNEGSVQVNVLLPPGASLKSSQAAGEMAAKRLQSIPEVTSIVNKTGRAELDEHAMGVNVSEMILALDPNSERDREAILEDIRHELGEIPGIVSSVEQPIAHLISHMLSGIKAQIGIKIYGEDLVELRKIAHQMQRQIADVPGLRDLMVEQQIEIPQLRIELDRDKLALAGLTPSAVNEFIETAMNGKVVSQILSGTRTFDLVVRLDEPVREDIEALKRLAIELPNGGSVPLDSVSKIYSATGPNLINREQGQRRIVLQANVSGRGVVDVVDEIRQKIWPIEAGLSEGYFIEFGGQFESQQSAQRVIGILFGASLVGMFLVLYTLFGSANFSWQVMAALPTALVGAVAALVITNQTLTVAAMVGFISLCGIASRNGILLLTHYVHLVQHEGERWSKEMLIRAGQERVAPVLMTALTSGIGLIPLAIAAGEPGKEILYPVATVLIGGLITSTLLEFFVRPALFWLFGVGAGKAIIAKAESEVLED